MGFENKTYPDELDFYVPFNWDNRKIWALQLPVETALVKDWIWHLDLPFWSTVPKQPLFNLRPREVLENPKEHPIHWERIERADIGFPVETLRVNNRWVILDGIHRLARLARDGAVEFLIRRVPESAVSLISV